jgi:hypothetical protein
VQANVIIGGQTNVITVSIAWQTNVYTFTAAAARPRWRSSRFRTDAGGFVPNDGSARPEPTNYYLPEESLDALTGQNSQGNWKLEVWDNRLGATNPSRR